MKTILVTGGAGFIGSNFIELILKKYPHYSIVNIDALTYAGDQENLSDFYNHERYRFVKGDIADKMLIEKLFNEYAFFGVIHFAAESHVDNSISGPEIFIHTNIYGTFSLLDAARKSWMVAPHEKRKGQEHNRFLHVSTDEVYGSLGATGLFTEQTAYAPNSPYAASKASSDMLVRSYYHTYGLNVVTTNCSNNYGPKQHSEKLIPTIIRSAISGRAIPVYGDGMYIRDWLYVKDHCEGIDLAFHRGKSGQAYNIGGRNERTNIQMVNLICEILDVKQPRTDGRSYKSQIEFVSDRAGHDRRYGIDASKIENELGWRSIESFETGIEKTVDWYLAKLSKY